MLRGFADHWGVSGSIPRRFATPAAFAPVQEAFHAWNAGLKKIMRLMSVIPAISRIHMITFLFIPDVRYFCAEKTPSNLRVVINWNCFG